MCSTISPAWNSQYQDPGNCGTGRGSTCRPVCGSGYTGTAAEIRCDYSYTSPSGNCGNCRPYGQWKNVETGGTAFTGCTEVANLCGEPLYNDIYLAPGAACSGTAVGGTCTPACANGWTATPAEPLTCQSDLTWSSFGGCAQSACPSGFGTYDTDGGGSITSSTMVAPTFGLSANECAAACSNQAGCQSFMHSSYSCEVLPNTYDEYLDTNTYAPPCGADVNIDGNGVSPYTAESCKIRCDEDDNCDCLIFRESDARCWKRGDCTPSAFCDGTLGYHTYVKIPGSTNCGECRLFASALPASPTTGKTLPACTSLCNSLSGHPLFFCLLCAPIFSAPFSLPNP